MTPIIKLKIFPKPVIKGKMDVRFPANVAAANFVVLRRSGGTYTLDADFSVLPPGPVSDPATAYVAVEDRAAGLYKVVSLASLLVSGLDADLQAIAALAGAGMLARTADNTWALRTLAGTANEITVTNGAGTEGNPTVSLPAAMTFTGKTVAGGTFNSPQIVTPTGIVKGDVGLGNADNTSDATKNAAAVTLTNKSINASNNTVTNLTTAMFAANVVDNDGMLTANSSTRVPTQAAVKAYADQIIASADAMVFKGVIDCSAGPNYPAADRGWTYKVSVAGKIGGASGVAVEVGDTLMCITDSTASGNQATVGAAWNIVQANLVGAVTGPASSTSGNIPTFNGTGGTVLQDSGKALPGGAIVGTTDTQALTGKTINGASNTLTVLAGSQLSGQVPVANGGTGATSITAALDTAFSNVHGSVLYRGATQWSALAPGSAGQFLTTQGAAASPNWSSGGAGTGTVTSVATGAGLTGGPITASGTISIAPGQLPGEASNGNAAAGNIGEFISSTVAPGSAVSAPSVTTTNITSITLTAGDWDVRGSVGTAPAATTNQTTVAGGITTASATLPTTPNSGAYFQLSMPFTVGLPYVAPTGTIRLSLSVTTTVYLIGYSNFNSGANAFYGFIGARRVR